MEDKSLEEGMTDSKTAREIAAQYCRAHNVLLREREAGGGCFNCYGLEQSILSYASDKDKRIEQLEAEVERLKADSSSGLSVKYKLELLKEINQLQLENGVMREALNAGIKTLKDHDGHPYCQLGDKYGVVDKMEQALSPSTKSSLMEKVRKLIEVTSKVNRAIGRSKLGDQDNTFAPNGTVKNMYDLMEELESALTEVKKALPHA